VSGAQIVILSILGFHLLCISTVIKNMGKVAKPTTPATVTVAVIMFIMLGMGSFYLYMT